MDVGAAARARRGIKRRGHPVSFRRLNRVGAVVKQADVKAVAFGYAPTDLVNGVTVGTRRLIVSKLDLEDAGYPVPPIKGDRIFFGAALDIETVIEGVDADHREYNGCYDITAKGS